MFSGENVPYFRFPFSFLSLPLSFFLAGWSRSTVRFSTSVGVLLFVIVITEMEMHEDGNLLKRWCFGNGRSLSFGGFVRVRSIFCRIKKHVFKSMILWGA